MIPFLLARRTAVALLLAAASLPMACNALYLRVDPGIESLIPSHGADLDRLRRFNAAFGSGEIIVVAFQADPLFTPPNLERIDELTRRAAALPGVVRVLSPTNARDLDGDELGPFSLVPYERVIAGELAPDELGRRLASHPLYGGSLVSSDARTAALLLEVERAAEQGSDRRGLVEEVRRLANEAGPGFTTQVAGLPVEKVDVAAYVRRDQVLFAPLILAMLAILTAALYRHPTGVAVPLGVVGASLLWTLGLYGMAGRSLNPVTSLMTPVVLVVSVEGVIHLMNHYLGARAAGKSRPEALRRAHERSWLPCFTAALTTAIGFSSLMLMPVPAIRDFGLFTAAGVMISWGFTIVLAPLLLAWLPDFPPRVTGTFHPGPVEHALKATASWVCRRPVVTAVSAVAVLVLSVAGVMRIRVETDIISSLSAKSPLYQATAFIDRHLTGVNSLEILVAGVAPGDPAGLQRLDAFEREVEAMSGVKKVTGLPDLFARVNRAFHSGDDRFERLPEGPEAAADLRDMRDLLTREAPEELSRFASSEERSLRLTARVAALDTASSQRLFEQIRDAASRAGLPGVELTGDFVVLSNMSTSLVSNQVRGLLPAVVLILAAMAVQLRSLRLGILSVIPNGAPVLMVYGLMGWMGIALSVPTAMIAGIAIGMTVDNTIHLMTHFREAWRRSGDYAAALGDMLDASGRAVVFSTAVLAAGFWVGVFASFRPSVHFALLTGAALLMGLASEAVLLPLTLIVFKPFGRPRGISR